MLEIVFKGKAFWQIFNPYQATERNSFFCRIFKYEFIQFAFKNAVKENKFNISFENFFLITKLLQMTKKNYTLDQLRFYLNN